MASSLYLLTEIAALKQYARDDVRATIEERPEEAPLHARMLGEDAAAKGLNIEQIGDVLSELAERDSPLWAVGIEAAKREVAFRDRLQKEADERAAYEPQPKANPPTALPAKPTNLGVAVRCLQRSGPI